jgi:hypothetical protein
MTRRVLTEQELRLISPSLTPQERQPLLHTLKAVADPLYWLMNCTKTVDEQDTTGNPYKAFPDRPYFHYLYKQFLQESTLFVEKSRTMMVTWLFAGIFLHIAMTRPGTRVVTVSKDEDKALVPIQYQRWLWENQEDELKRTWPLARPMGQQSVYALELANDSVLTSLPGKDPDKIRSLHPTYVFFDEAAYMDEYRRSHDAAFAARPLKIVSVSSAHPGHFREITRTAVPVEL